MVDTKKNFLILGMTNNPGGVETYIKTLVDTISGEYNILIAKKPQVELRNGGQKVKYVDCPFIDSTVDKVLGKHKIARWLVNQKIDVVYVNALSVNLAVWVSAGKTVSIPVFYHSHNEKELHSGFIRSLLSSILSGHNRKVLSSANRVACSSPAGNFMFGNTSFKVILNGVDPSVWCFSREKRDLIRSQFGIVDNMKVLCVVARMQKQKNYPKIISVVKKLLTSDSSFCVLIVGDGEEQPDVSAALKGFIDEGRVHLLGSIDYVDAVMSAGDVLLLPSLFEGLPYTIVEAQAAGIPIVASFDAFPVEAEVSGTVFSKLGLLADDYAWTNAIKQLSSITNNERLAANKLVADSKFNIENTKKQIRRLLQIE